MLWRLLAAAPPQRVGVPAQLSLVPPARCPPARCPGVLQWTGPIRVQRLRGDGGGGVQCGRCCRPGPHQTRNTGHGRRLRCPARRFRRPPSRVRMHPTRVRGPLTGAAPPAPPPPPPPPPARSACLTACGWSWAGARTRSTGRACPGRPCERSTRSARRNDSGRGSLAAGGTGGCRPAPARACTRGCGPGVALAASVCILLPARLCCRVAALKDPSGPCDMAVAGMGVSTDHLEVRAGRLRAGWPAACNSWGRSLLSRARAQPHRGRRCPLSPFLQEGIVFSWSTFRSGACRVPPAAAAACC